MTFLGMSPGMMGVLLGATVATVVFLYWLKPPPQRVVVPSTLLWDRLLKEKKMRMHTVLVGGRIGVDDSVVM